MKYRIGFVPQKNLIRGNDTVIRTVSDAAELRLPSGVLAGSALTMERGLKNFTANANATLEETWQCSSLNAARLIGIDHETGSIEKGKLADLVLIDPAFDVKRTIIEGKTIYKSEIRNQK